MNNTPFHELAAVIADEEKGAASKAIAQRIATIEQMPDGPVRARIYAAAMLIASAELWAELDEPRSVACQLKQLAARLERH